MRGGGYHAGAFVFKDVFLLAHKSSFPLSLCNTIRITIVPIVPTTTSYTETRRAAGEQHVFTADMCARIYENLRVLAQYVLSPSPPPPPSYFQNGGTGVNYHPDPCAGCFENKPPPPDVFTNVDDISTTIIKRTILCLAEKTSNPADVYVMLTLFVSMLKMLGLDPSITKLLLGGVMGSVTDAAFKALVSLYKMFIYTDEDTHQRTVHFSLGIYASDLLTGVKFGGGCSRSRRTRMTTMAGGAPPQLLWERDISESFRIVISRGAKDDNLDIREKILKNISTLARAMLYSTS